MEKKLDFRIEKTYLSLYSAFTSLLEEKKFEEFTVNELCERAMIRRTTFYKHFADKYEYFTFYIKETCNSFQDQLPPDVKSYDVNEYFLHMCRELLRFIEKHEKLVMNVANSTMFPILMDSLMEQISMDVSTVLKHMDETRKMTPAQISGLATFYAGGLVNTLRQKLKHASQINTDEFMDIISICFTYRAKDE